VLVLSPKVTGLCGVALAETYARNPNRKEA